MKVLVIRAKYNRDGVIHVVEARVPYEFGKSFNLPDIYPFNQNLYFGPDTGTYLGRIYIDKEGRIDYVENLVTLHEGVNVYTPLKKELFIFEFEVVEE